MLQKVQQWAQKSLKTSWTSVLTQTDPVISHNEIYSFTPQRQFESREKLSNVASIDC